VIGLWSGQASEFLVVTALMALVTLGLPMLLTPLTWAGWLRWPVPAATDGRDLATYFGRCLGAVICVQAAVVLLNATDDDVQPVLFAIVTANFALMVAIHLWGAWRRIQPVSETVETAAWAALLVLGLLFWPS
jgi:hypothetical protein